MKGQNIICFARDWHDDPTSNNHVMAILARDNRVLWLNSIAMRRPTFTSRRDLGTIARKLKSFFRGTEQPAPNLWVVTPIVLPFPYDPTAIAINRWILKATIGYYRRKLGMRRFQLWTFVPNAVEYVGQLGESLVVYYCIDEWSGFSYIDGEKMAMMERKLLERADICFATSHLLYESKRHLNANTHLALHGVDRDHFAAALAPDTEIPEDIAALPSPIVGFFGQIHDWIDLPLIANIARAHPEWSVVLIGRISVDVAPLRSLPNIHFLGRRPYEALPGYCKAFDVGIVPFVVNGLTRNVNPIKLREYLSAGLPVVSTDLPEVTHCRDLAYVTHTHREFIAAVEQALREDSPARRRHRSEAMLNETWERRVAMLGDEVIRTQGRR